MTCVGYLSQPGFTSNCLFLHQPQVQKPGKPETGKRKARNPGFEHQAKIQQHTCDESPYRHKSNDIALMLAILSYSISRSILKHQKQSSFIKIQSNETSLKHTNVFEMSQARSIDTHVEQLPQINAVTSKDFTGPVLNGLDKVYDKFNNISRSSGAEVFATSNRRGQTLNYLEGESLSDTSANTDDSAQEHIGKYPRGRICKPHGHPDRRGRVGWRSFYTEWWDCNFFFPRGQVVITNGRSCDRCRRFEHKVDSWHSITVGDPPITLRRVHWWTLKFFLTKSLK